MDEQHADEREPTSGATQMPDPPLAEPSRRRAWAIFAVATVLVGILVIAAVATARHGSRTTNVSETLVRFTSDTGRVTMVVPRTWDEQTAEVRDFLDQPAGRPVTIEAGWVLAGESFLGGSLLVVISYRAGDITVEDASAIAFDSLRDSYTVFADATLSDPEFVTTATGIPYARQDITIASAKATVGQTEILMIVDDTMFEISLTLVGDAVDRLDEAIEAINTLTVSTR